MPQQRAKINSLFNSYNIFSDKDIFKNRSNYTKSLSIQ